MPYRSRTLRNLSSLAALLGATLLAGCQPDEPAPPRFDLPPAITVTAERAAVVTAEDTPVEFQLSVTVSAALPAVIRVVQAPAHGAIVQQGTQIRYTPDPDYHGDDTLTYTARVSTTTSDPATVAITITPVNDPPQIEPLNFAVFENDRFRGWFDVFDVEGDDVAVETVTAPAHGSVVIDNLLERFTYTPTPGYSGQDRFWVRATDGQDASAPVPVDVLVIETEPPAVTSVTLAGGAAAVAATAEVSLVVLADASATEMRIRGDVVRPDPSWRPWTGIQTVDLTPGDGTKTVRVQVRDRLGNRSTEVTDTVFLDQSGPSIAVTAPSATSSVTVDAALFITDPTAPLAVRISGAVTGTSPDLSGWSPLTTAVRWWLPATEGVHAITIEARDGFGHVATATVLQAFDRTPPTGGLTANLIAVDPVTLGTRPTTATNVRNVALNASWNDLTSAVTAVVLSGDLDNPGWFTGFNPGSATSGTAPLPDFATLTTGDGPKTVSGVFVDAAGNRSAATSVTMLLDTTPPSLAAVTLAGGAQAVSTTTIPITFTASSDVYAIAVTVTNNGLLLLTGGVIYPTQLTEVELGLVLDGTIDVWLIAQDSVGNLTGPVGDSIRLDRIPPAASVTAAASVTTQPELTLWFSGDVTTDVATIELTGDLAAPVTLPGVASATVTLAAGDGVKTIHAAFRDEAGNLTVDTVMVTLDAIPFSLDVTVDSAYTATTEQTLWIAVTEAAGAVSMQVTGQILNPLTTWTPLTSPVPVWLTTFEGPHAITVTVRDTSPETLTATVTVTLDTMPPSLSAVTLAGGGHGPVSSTALSLAVLATDATEMEVTGDVVAPTGRLPLVASRTVTVPAGVGVRAVWVNVYDAAGQSAGPLSDYVWLDSVPPAPPTTVTAVAGELSVQLAWSPVSDAADYLVFYGTSSGGPYTGTGANEGASPVVAGASSITLTGLAADVTIYATIVARDSLLNASSASTEVSATPWAALDVTVQADYGRIATGASEGGAITGTTVGGELGAALATGDFDGDGDLDLAIGEPTPSGEGTVRILDLVTQNFLAALTASGRVAERFGAALASGDFNGDGVDDIAVGEPDGAIGQVYLLEVTSGQQIARLDGVSGGEFGSSIAVVGDFTGDGQADLVVGEPGYGSGAGRVRQYDGATRNELPSVNGTAGDRFGAPIVPIGDINSDGRGDWAAAATPAASGAGYVSLVSGGTATEIDRITGAAAGSWFGQAVTASEGLIAIGAPGATNGSLRPGSVAVFRITDTSLVWTRLGDLDDARLGGALLWIDDLNGDGQADLLAGAPEAAPGTIAQGAVYAFSGSDGELLFRIDPDGSASGSRFGATLARIGDEIVIGAPGDNRGAADAGRVSLQTLRTLARQAFPTTQATLAITATPAVMQIELRINGGAWQLAPIASNLTVTTPADGVHNVDARGVDSAGHRGDVTNVTLRTDLAAPVTAWIAAPVSGSVLSGGATLSGAVSDATSPGTAGMLAAEWALALSSGTDWLWHNGAAVTGTVPYWFVLPTTGPVDVALPVTGPGDWQVRLRGRDAAWHPGPASTSTFQLTP